MAVNFNVEPYFDDYSEDKKFHRILFRPGYSVQARELTQLQTILQKQIERVGNHLFKQGAMVIPGQIFYDQKLQYVKLTARYNNVDTASFISTLIGTRIKGLTSGVEAQVVQSTKATGSDPNMIFVKYVKNGFTEAGDEGAQDTFIAGEILQTMVDSEFDQYTFQIQTVNTTVNPAFGFSTGASISRGVYYINGFFVLVEDQTILLDKFSTTPSYKIGLKIVESVVEPEDDETLLDNAQNSYNYAAPGAHRYSIDAQLIKRSLTSTDSDDFIELLRVAKGKIQFIVNRTEYGVIEETLARRTYDESGNYTTRDFGIEVREYRSNSRGAWAPNVAYLIGDIVTSGGKTYVAKNSAISSNASSIAGDSSVTWQEDAAPKYNRGINYPPQTVKEPVLDANGNPTFNYDTDGSILSQIFSTRNATVADNKLWNSKLSVGIEAGKAYVYGYEIEKVATTYVDVDKAREIASETNRIIGANYGNYVIVGNVNYVPNINVLPSVKIYSGYTSTAGAIASGAVEVGSARVRGLEYHSGSGAGTLYKLFLFDINMNYVSGSSGAKYSFNDTAKQFRIAGASNALSFTADAAVDPLIMTGAITVAGSNITSIVGVNTKFLTEFAVGDYIYLDNAPRKITAITTNLNMTIDTGVSAQNGTLVLKCKSLLVDQTSVAPIFQLPQYAINTISQASYTVSQAFTTTATAGGVVTITTSGGNEFTNPAMAGNYLLFAANGNPVTPASATRAPNNLTVDFTVNISYANQAFVVIATVQRDINTGLKIKTASTNSFNITSAATTQSSKIFLGKPDGIKVKSVMMAEGYNFTTNLPTQASHYNKDITSWYTFDGGQTDAYYGIAFITRKAGRTPPASPIRITFDYYSHSSGDFFTVDSYPNYEDIPMFNQVYLRDCIDFRPRVDDSSTGAVVFTGNDDCLPRFGQDILIDYEYYLAKNVKIALDKTGNFKVLYGASNLDPTDPADSLDGMTLYKLQLEPYTFGTTTASVAISKVDNRRYTMRDIGKIDKRLSELEYYTSLSLLEQDTSNLLIQDEDGFNRFKNGFIVDNFKSQAVGDTASEDYLCSIDVQNGVLRPFFSMTNLDFVETFSNNVDRKNASVNYVLTGDVVSLPYTNLNLITQDKASTTVNVNPYDVYNFIGSADVTPPFDRWFEVSRRPDIIISVEGNYAAIKTLAERTGVLGTVWNSWQTQWTGSKDTLLDPVWVKHKRGVGDLYNQTTITATTTVQRRTGINTSVKETFEKRTIDDKVLSVAAIPFIRSRNVLIQAKNLKPSTKFWPFFDKQSVSQYCLPASKLVVSRSSLTDVEFDSSTNVGNEYKNVARMKGNNPDFAINIGDVLFVSKRSSSTYTVSSSPTTAVVVGTGEKYVSGGTVYQEIFVVNEKTPGVTTTSSNAFIAADVVTGSLSEATATVSSYVQASLGQSLITDNVGQVQFIFNIPNTDAIKFRAGKKEIALLMNNSYDISASSASNLTANYEAQGYIETRQSTVQSIRNAKIVDTEISENRTLVNKVENTTSFWVDPLAQTFLVNAYPDGAPTGNLSANIKSIGCFITKVDLYFKTKDTTGIPVTVQIREVVNGYPGRKVLPFAEATLYPSQINTSANASVATTFTFKSPVYVASDAEYAIVILANSKNYNVWCSELGGRDTITGAFIDKQPYAGVLFKSQNASTWTAEQSQDLKFKLYRAKFTTGTVGRVEFENAIIPEANLDLDPLQFKSGSNKVRVHMRNHGMTVGSKITLNTPLIQSVGTITISGTSATGVNTDFLANLNVGSALYNQAGTLIGVVSSIASPTSLTLAASPTPVNSSGISFSYKNGIFGIAAQNLFKQHIVSQVNELDSFIITVASNATATGFGGGETITAAGNVMFDAIQPAADIQSFTNTIVTPYFMGVTGKSVDGTEIPYVLPASSGYGWMPVTLNETNYMPVPFVIANNDNTLTQLLPNGSYGSAIDLSTKTGQKCTGVLRFDIYSDVDTLSPIIDVRSVNAIMISNKINNPQTTISVSSLDERVIISGASDITFSTKVITIGDTGENRAFVTTMRSGQYLTITGSTSGSQTVLVTDISSDGSSIQVDQNISGIVGNVTLTAKDRFFNELTPFGSSAYSKYVTKRIDLLNESSFLKIRYAASVPTAADIEIYYKLGLTGVSEDFNFVEYRKASVAYSKSNDEQFKDVEIDIPDLPNFNALALKIVMKSTDSTYVPELRDLRIIACA